MSHFGSKMVQFWIETELGEIVRGWGSLLELHQRVTMHHWAILESKISLIEVTQFWMDQEVTSKLSHIIVSGVLYGHDSNDHRVMEKESL